MHDHHDHGGHGHGHSHAPGAGQQGDDMSAEQEYRMRITRWRDHNREHQQSLQDWSGKIRDGGYGETAAAMDRAADLLGESVAALDQALKTLG